MNVFNASRCLIALVACAFSGCATAGFLRFSKDELPKAGPNNPVVSVATIWQPAAEVIYNNKSYRGFYGQVNFMAAIKEGEPVRVDGTVTVYVFDDHGSAAEQTRPIDRFRFTSTEWNALVHKGKLGATYALFIPYTRNDPNEATCSLLVRYVPNPDPVTGRPTGQTVQSEMSHVDLPGTRRPDAPPAGETGSALTPTADELLSRLNSLSRGLEPKTNGATVNQPAEDLSSAVSLEGLTARPMGNRRAPVEMTAEEEARIIRETLAQQKSESLAPRADDGVAAEPAPRIKRHLEQHPLATADDDINDDVDDLPPPTDRTGQLIPASKNHPLSGL